MMLSKEDARWAGGTLISIINNVETVIIGKHETVSLVLVSLIAGGHVLLEDVPGVGKTSLISAIARSIDCDFSRIQFTPDLMPSDVTGFSIYNQKSGEFEFRQGAVMSNLVLADEINRASAKTQSSLLEAMEERQVTVDNKTYNLEAPFMVMATQNPIESFGTYPLPEAQVDRFLMKLSMGYPTIEEETRVLSMARNKKKELQPAVTRAEVLRLMELADQVRVSQQIARYIAEIVASTRSSADITLGSSPRGSIALYHSAQAYALMQGRDYVLPDDVKYLAPYTLAHRLSLSHEARVAKKTGKQIIADILQRVVVPVED